MTKLRVLDLFSGIKAPSLMADSASDPKERGRLGKESKPFLDSCSCLNAKRHCGDVLACEQCQERGFPRMTDTLLGRLGSEHKNVLGSHLGHASLLPAHNKRPLSLGSVCRTLSGYLWRFSPNKRRNNAICSPQSETQSETLCRTVGNDVGLARQLSFAASEISLCIQTSTISKLLCPLDTRSHISRSVLGVLP